MTSQMAFGIALYLRSQSTQSLVSVRMNPVLTPLSRPCQLTTRRQERRDHPAPGAGGLEHAEPGGKANERLARPGKFSPPPPSVVRAPSSAAWRAPALDPPGAGFGTGDLGRRVRGRPASKGVHPGVARSPERRSERSARRDTGEMDLYSLG